MKYSAVTISFNVPHSR